MAPCQKEGIVAGSAQIRAERKRREGRRPRLADLYAYANRVFVLLA
jgi:hypothetical protein